MLGLRRGRSLRLVGGSSRKRTLEWEDVRRFRRLLLLRQVNWSTTSSHYPTFHTLRSCHTSQAQGWNPALMTALRPAVGCMVASLFIGKYHTLGCDKPAISGVAHKIEKIEPASSAYLERADPLPSIHFTLSHSSIKEKLTHFSIGGIREVELSCQTYGDDYWFSSPTLSVSFAMHWRGVGFSMVFFGFGSLSSPHVYPPS